MEPSVIYTMYQVFAKFFISRLFGSYRQWAVFLLISGFTVFAIVFYSYLNNFHTVFIQSLKKVYPEIYIQSHGRHINPLEVGIIHQLEYFDIASQLVFKYRKDGSYKKIMDLGLRSMSQDSIEKIFPMEKDDDSDDFFPVMWVNDSLWDFLSESGQFDGNGIWVKNDSIHGDDLYLKIRVFHFHGLKYWAVLPQSAMEQLGRPCNITTIYPPKKLPVSRVKKRYRENRIQIIEWTDRLPFFIKVVFLLSKRIYAVLMLSFLLLVMFMAVGIFQDTMTELRIMIQFASLYGARRYKIYLFAVFCICIYFGAVFLTGILGGQILSLTLSSAVPALGFIRNLSRDVWQLFWLMPVMCIMAAGYVYIVFNSRLKISE